MPKTLVEPFTPNYILTLCHRCKPLSLDSCWDRKGWRWSHCQHQTVRHTHTRQWALSVPSYQHSHQTLHRQPAGKTFIQVSDDFSNLVLESKADKVFMREELLGDCLCFIAILHPLRLLWVFLHQQGGRWTEKVHFFYNNLDPPLPKVLVISLQGNLIVGLQQIFFSSESKVDV